MQNTKTLPSFANFISNAMYPQKVADKGKQYSGEFMHVMGAGDTQVWHLMIDNYYKARLRYTDKWIFDSNTMPEIADLLGEYVVDWNQ